MTDAKKAATAEDGESYEGFTEAEIAAMKERAKEIKKAKRGVKSDPLADLLEKIVEMPEPDRSIAGRLHSLITEAAPSLSPRLWYGMPAYAVGAKNGKGGEIVCFVQTADKFKSRYLTLGFNDAARLDEGTMWPTSFAITELTPAHEKTVTELVKKAMG
ncbi:iron chaperone [Streptomyces sp. MAR4 CNX-425]|uniref:iron chaperone n=1 Tax=Streptomyces sp. MAR4 CNX-425 TaxID=3406343 RepID=UPI003B50AD06